MSNKSKLNIIAIHGTFSGEANLKNTKKLKEAFYSKNSAFAKKLISNLCPQYYVEWDDTFQWNGENLESSRIQATKDLKIHIEKYHTENNKLLLLAHSHGGNVAQDWITQHSKKYDANLITFGTCLLYTSPSPRD